MVPGCHGVQAEMPREAGRTIQSSRNPLPAHNARGMLQLACLGADYNWPQAGRQSRRKGLMSYRAPSVFSQWASATEVDGSGAGLRAAGGSARLAPFHSTKWQATQWLGRAWRKTGSSAEQISWVMGQRVWNTQPEGGLAGLGTSPWRMVRWRWRSTAGWGTGTAEMSASV